MRIEAFMDEQYTKGGAAKHFDSFVWMLNDRGHLVERYHRIWRSGYRIPYRDIPYMINHRDFDVVFVMHFTSVWIIPFLKKPVVLYLLEPPRPFHERWLYKEYPIWKKVLIQVQGRIDRYIVEHYVQHGIANRAFSGGAGLKAYGIFCEVVYPSGDRREFYPEEE